MKSREILELLKQLGYITVNVLWQIIKNIWTPIYTTLVKVALIALVIWGLCMLPHGLFFLNNISYLGWYVAILIVRLLQVRYDDFESEDNGDDKVSPPPYLDDDEDDEEEIVKQQLPPAAPNVLKKEIKDGTYSTRE